VTAPLLAWFFWLTVTWTTPGTGGANPLGFTPAQLALLHRAPAVISTQTVLLGAASHAACEDLRSDIAHYGPLTVALAGGQGTRVATSPCQERMVGDPSVEETEWALGVLEEWCAEGRP